jgi:hypothetical protein
MTTPSTPTGEALIARLEAAEHIVAAAIQVAVPEDYRAKVWRGKRSYPDCITISAPPPARHHTLLAPAYDLTNGKRVESQGFITSTGRYVERAEALQIALASGQPMIDHPSRHDTHLFSEDLW